MQIGTYARHHEQLAESVKYEPDFVDIRLDLNHTIKYSQARRILQDANIACTLHLPSSPEWRPTDIGREIIPYIDIGVDLEAEIVTFHSALSSLFYEDEEIDAFIQSIPLACDAAAEGGMELSIETLGLYYTELAILFEECNVNLALDLGHGQIFALRNRALELMQSFPKRIKLVNVHDNHGNDMVEEVLNLKKKCDLSRRDIRDLAIKYDTHLPIGEGNIDFRKIFKALKEIQYEDKFLMMSKDPHRYPTEKEKFLEIWLES